MAPRSSAVGDQAPPPPPSSPAALVRGDRVTLQATIVRSQGPTLQVQVLGELMTVLRSTLEKEIARP